VNGWDVQPTLEQAIARSSGQILRNRLITAPGPAPVPPAAQLGALTVRAGHPVVVSTAACRGATQRWPRRLDGGFHLPPPHPRTDRVNGVTPHRVTTATSAQECRAPNGFAVCAHHADAHLAPATGAALVLKTGAEILRGNTRAHSRQVVG
jgi:hypothetical protein